MSNRSKGSTRGGAQVIDIDASRRARRATGADAVAAGAARAGGERARRRRPSLLGPDVLGEPFAAEPRVAAEPPMADADATASDLRSELGLELGSEPGAKPGMGASKLAQHAVEALVEALVAEAHRAGVTDIDRRVAEALAWVRRRLAGDYTIDQFGFDAELTDAVLPLLRPLYRSWFRVQVRGIENVPATGGALIVANHSGTIALDSLMTQLAIHDEHPGRRYLRLLGADLVFTVPVLGELARKTGSTLATSADARQLLRGGELVGVWPEGFKGISKPFAERYKLQRFGRGGFVSAALEARVPIVPCSIVGAEEIYPILGDFTTLARLLGLPFLPITPTFPWLGLLGLIPLPSKWIIEFGTPIETKDLAKEHGDGAADDPMLVFDLTDQVRETIQQTLYALLLQRRSVFF